MIAISDDGFFWVVLSKFTALYFCFLASSFTSLLCLENHLCSAGCLPLGAVFLQQGLPRV